MSVFDPTAPKYRYFVADLMSNTILAEIPFTGVSYERSLKSAGSFSGSIAVIDRTAAMNLYDSTMPGRTSLYVVRNGECVWGGIIWSRAYSAMEKTMTVSASEFTSYLHHRNIWKTYSHNFGATLTSSLGVATVTLDSGQFDFSVGMPVKIEFYEISNFVYDGYYTIISPGLSSTTFSVSIPSLPGGTYENVTVKVRVDTYDYVRQLLDELSIDFTGIEFPNGEIEPYNSINYSVVNKELTSNIATLTTSGNHELIAGQSAVVRNVDSTFNGRHTLTNVTDNTVTFVLEDTDVPSTAISGATTSVTSKSVSLNIVTLTTASAHNLSAGDIVSISNVDDPAATFVLLDGVKQVESAPTATTFTYMIFGNNEDVAETVVAGSVTKTPSVSSGTYGPFPGNSNIGIDYSTGDYSEVSVPNQTYRGYELRSVGEELDEYSDVPSGFEYRIDCAYDPTTLSFTRTFVLLPINFPDPPNPGQVAPLSRYGADRLVFEYPGNVNNVTIDESAENAATRFFVVGNIPDLGDEASQPYAVATATDLLDLGWPLLDGETNIQNEYDEERLYSYAQRYLVEMRPPVSDIKISINGTMSPSIGQYAPGDWCAIIIDDEFIRMRLSSDLEPRDEIIVRKIENIKINVPDGVAFPEEVEVLLIPEWEVDKIGE